MIPVILLFTYGINDGINLPQVKALPVTVPQQNITWDFAFTPNTSGLLRGQVD